jgi:archaemetzincin
MFTKNICTAALAVGLAMQFVPPNEAQRSAAVGPVSSLPESLRPALEPGNSFQPMGTPAPEDWLANHREPGQTFGDFVGSHPNRPDGRRIKIYLQPLGDLSRSGGPSVDKLLQFAPAFFGMETTALPALDLSSMPVTRRRNPSSGQEQLLTTDVLELLRQRLPNDAFGLIGITMIDLYPDPQWNFVFGQASLRDRTGVYSFARYDPRFYGETRADAQELILRRSCKVLVHETGHMFGIEHCIWYRCLMNGSNHIEEADARPFHLCPVDLRKLQWSAGFDVLERYGRLRAFAEQAGFRDGARWLQMRVHLIEGL